MANSNEVYVEGGSSSAMVEETLNADFRVAAIDEGGLRQARVVNVEEIPLSDFEESDSEDVDDEVEENLDAAAGSSSIAIEKALAKLAVNEEEIPLPDFDDLEDVNDEGVTSSSSTMDEESVNGVKGTDNSASENFDEISISDFDESDADDEGVDSASSTMGELNFDEENSEDRFGHSSRASAAPNVNSEEIPVAHLIDSDLEEESTYVSGFIIEEIPLDHIEFSDLEDDYEESVPRVENGPEEIDVKAGTVQFGPNKTSLPLEVYNTVNWECYKMATRALLMAIFTKAILATHSMTGKTSPAFAVRGAMGKPKLDEAKVEDIVDIVCKKCKDATARMVRAAVTAKCADESKLMRRNQQADSNIFAIRKRKRNLYEE